MSRLITYFKETRAELKHVTWPTRKQAIVYTVVVILISLGTAAYLGAFDYLFSILLTLIIG
ncbi:MAG: preprotein translocase subunit SecE [bacterium]|nr:preprotein translocase subunit SecE [bacterium]